MATKQSTTGAAKEISKASMMRLRTVLQGKDAKRMWQELNQLGLSPMDKVNCLDIPVQLYATQPQPAFMDSLRELLLNACIRRCCSLHDRCLRQPVSTLFGGIICLTCIIIKFCSPDTVQYSMYSSGYIVFKKYADEHTYHCGGSYDKISLLLLIHIFLSPTPTPMTVLHLFGVCLLHFVVFFIILRRVCCFIATPVSTVL